MKIKSANNFCCNEMNEGNGERKKAREPTVSTDNQRRFLGLNDSFNLLGGNLQAGPIMEKALIRTIDFFKIKMQEEKVPSLRGEIKVLRSGNKIFRSVYDHHLTEEDLQKAALELGETEQLRITSLQKLRQKLQDHDNLLYRFDDAYLLRYLRYTKFTINRAFKSLNKLYNLWKNKPEIFALPDNVHEFLDSGFLTLLPYRDQENSIIFWIDFSKWNVEHMTIVGVAQITSAILELSTMNPSFQVHSTISVWDLSGFSMEHFRTLSSPRTLIWMLNLMIEIYPKRIKQVFLLNCFTFVRKAYEGVRYLIKKKIADRVVILGSDPSELHQYLDKDILPKEYGGTVEESVAYALSLSWKTSNI